MRDGAHRPAQRFANVALGIVARAVLGSGCGRRSSDRRLPQWRSSCEAVWQRHSAHASSRGRRRRRWRRRGSSSVRWRSSRFDAGVCMIETSFNGAAASVDAANRLIASSGVATAAASARPAAPQDSSPGRRAASHRLNRCLGFFRLSAVKEGHADEGEEVLGEAKAVPPIGSRPLPRKFLRFPNGGERPETRSSAGH